jgi:hypothetical protein
VANLNDPKFMEAVIAQEIVDKLILFTGSGERDRFEAAVLALSFLSEDR